MGIRCYGGAVVMHTIRAWLSLLAAWLLFLMLTLGAVIAVGGAVPALDRILAPAGIVTLLVAAASASTLALIRPIVPWLFVTIVTATVAGCAVVIAATMDEPRVSTSVIAPIVDIEDEALVRGRDVALYTGTVDGIALNRPAVLRFDRLPRISRPPEAVIDSANALILVPGESDISLTRFETLRRPEVPRFVGRVGTDAILVLQRLATVLAAEEVRVQIPGEIEEALAIAVPTSTLRRVVSLIAWFGGLAFAVAMAWTPARLTRWQLLNWLLALLYVRVLLALPRWIALPTEENRWLAPLARLPSEWAVALLWIACAVVLLVIAIVLPSLRAWRREFGVET